MRRFRVDKFYEHASAELIEEQRHRGCDGGHIQVHRALLTSPLDGSKLISSAGLAISVFVLWLFSMKWVNILWKEILSFWSEALEMSSYVSIVRYRIGGAIDFSATYLHARSPQPDSADLITGTIVTLIVLLATFLLPRRLVPLIYLLRVIVFFHICALLFFAFGPLPFPYGVSGYVHASLIAGLFLISMIPIVLAFTFFIFDFHILKKIALTLLIMFYFIVFLPMQFLAHAFILDHTSLLMLPLLFFIFGLPLDVMIFIAFYSWGASWKNRLYREPVPRGNGFFE